MNMKSVFEDWMARCRRVDNLIHAALKTVENSSTQDSDEMAATEVLRIASKEADDLFGVIWEAKEGAEKSTA